MWKKFEFSSSIFSNGNSNSYFEKFSVKWHILHILPKIINDGNFSPLPLFSGSFKKFHFMHFFHNFPESFGGNLFWERPLETEIGQQF